MLYTKKNIRTINKLLLALTLALILLATLPIIYSALQNSLRLNARGHVHNSYRSKYSLTHDFISTQVFRLQLWIWVVPYDPSSPNSLLNYVSKYTWASPAWYVIDSSGNIDELYFNETILKILRYNNVSIVPLITVKDFNAETLHRILNNSDLRENVIDGILRIVLKRGYDGINIDFENLTSCNGHPLEEFMKILYVRFKVYDKLVTIDVPAKIGEGDEWSRCYNYTALSLFSDYTIIMAYDYHWSKGGAGPITPTHWLEKVIKYAKLTIPKEKIVIALPLYGYKWWESGYVESLRYVDIIEELGANTYSVKHPPIGGASYKVFHNKTSYEVWFNDAEVIKKLLTIIDNEGLNKVAFWRAGHEDPKIYETITRLS